MKVCSVVAGVGVEHAVEAEVDGAAVVVGGAAEVVPVEDRGFVGEDRLLGVGVVDGEAAELVVLAGGPGSGAGVGVGVVEVDVMVGAEVGIEGDAEQPALARGVDIEVERGPGGAVGVDELDVAALFEDEQPAVGREIHRRRRGQAAGHQRLRESAGQRGRHPSRFQPLHRERLEMPECASR